MKAEMGGGGTKTVIYNCQGISKSDTHLDRVKLTVVVTVYTKSLTAIHG